MWNNAELEHPEPWTHFILDLLCGNLGLALAITLPILIVMAFG